MSSVSTVTSYSNFSHPHNYLDSSPDFSQLENIRQSLISQEAVVRSMHSAVLDMRLERINRQVNALATSSSWDDVDARIVKIIRGTHTHSCREFQVYTYTRDDINLLQTIHQYPVYLRSYPGSAWEYFTVKLHKAKRYDNRVVLIKSYHDVSSLWKIDCVSPFCPDSTNFSSLLVSARPHYPQANSVGHVGWW